MPYANFRKFVFCVPTACTLVSRTNPNIQCVVCGWDPGDYPGPDVLGTEITGHLATAVTNADMRKRLTWLLVAIEHTIAADRRNTPTPPGDTLRIFVVPEFYFRTTWQEQERGRDYTKEEFAELTGALSFYFDSYSRLHRCAPLRDWLFLCGFFKTAYKFGASFILFIVVSFIVVIIGEVLHHIPALEFLNGTDTLCDKRMWIILAAGIVFYVLVTFVSCRVAMKRFERVDM